MVVSRTRCSGEPRGLASQTRAAAESGSPQAGGGDRCLSQQSQSGRAGSRGLYASPVCEQTEGGQAGHGPNSERNDSQGATSSAGGGGTLLGAPVEQMESGLRFLTNGPCQGVGLRSLAATLTPRGLGSGPVAVRWCPTGWIGSASHILIRNPVAAGNRRTQMATARPVVMPTETAR